MTTSTTGWETIDTTPDTPSLHPEMLAYIKAEPRLTATPRVGGGWIICWRGEQVCATRSSHYQYGLAALKVGHRRAIESGMN